jgi:hypothetical protein
MTKRSYVGSNLRQSRHGHTKLNHCRDVEDNVEPLMTCENFDTPSEKRLNCRGDDYLHKNFDLTDQRSQGQKYALSLRDLPKGHNTLSIDEFKRVM